MLAPTPSFHEALAGLRAGDQDAARRIYERYIHQLVRLAQGQLDRRHGPVADPESVAHSVFESFFSRQAAGQFTLENWGMVFGLLAKITERKCLNRNRDLGRQKRDGGGAVSFEDWQRPADGPTPDDEAMLADLLATAREGLDPDEQLVIDAMLAGDSPEVIADRQTVSVRTVQRVIQRFRDRVLELIEGND